MCHRPHSWLLAVAALTLAVAWPAEARCRRALVEADAGRLLGHNRLHPDHHPTASGVELGEDPTAVEDAPDLAERPARNVPAKPESPSPVVAAAGLESTSSPARKESAAPPAPRRSPPPPLPSYTISLGETLRSVLARWADASGWQLVWEPSQDYSLSAPASFTGDFREAVTQIMESLKGNGAPFGAELYTGNRVLRVTRIR